MTTMTETPPAISDAGLALAALNAAIGGREANAPATTDVASLADLKRVIEGLVIELRRERAEGGRLKHHLSRIANLELRGGRDLIEERNWKRVADEMQAIAESALGPATHHKARREG